MGLGVQRLAHVALPPAKETQYPMNSRLVGPQGRSVRVRKTSSPLGFDARTIQTIAIPSTLSRATKEFGVLENTADKLFRSTLVKQILGTQRSPNDRDCCI
jgi:hypothetical protein